MKLEELKIKAFEIRRKIDAIDHQKTLFVKEYNELYFEIDKLESENRKGNNDNRKVGNKIIADK